MTLTEKKKKRVERRLLLSSLSAKGNGDSPGCHYFFFLSEFGRIRMGLHAHNSSTVAAAAAAAVVVVVNASPRSFCMNRWTFVRVKEKNASIYNASIIS